MNYEHYRNKLAFSEIHVLLSLVRVNLSTYVILNDTEVIVISFSL